MSEDKKKKEKKKHRNPSTGAIIHEPRGTPRGASTGALIPSKKIPSLKEDQDFSITKDIPPFHQLILQGDSKAVMKFLAEKPKEELLALVNLVGQNQITPLHLAAFEGNFEIVKFLLEQGANVHARDKNNWTALHCSAATYGSRTPKHLDTCALLLRYGANPNAVTESNTSVIHYLVRYPYSEKLKQVLELLRERGADVDVVEEMGETPLHQAAFRGSPQTCIFLIKAGAGVNVLNQNGETPLHLAARAGKKDVVEALLMYEADPYIVGDNGTAREVAFVSNNQEVVDLFDEDERVRQDHELGDDEGSLIEAPILHSLPVSTSKENKQEEEAEILKKKMGSREISRIIQKNDVFEAFGLAFDDEVLPTSRTQSVLHVDSPKRARRPSRTIVRDAQRERRVRGPIQSHPGFNLELGTKSKEIESTNDLSLEYTDEHDDFYFTLHFLKDPEHYLKSLQKVEDVDLEQAFYRHINIIAERDASQVIISVKLDPEDGNYRSILRTKTGDKTFWLNFNEVDVKEGRAVTEKQILKALQMKNIFQSSPLTNLTILNDLHLAHALVHLDHLLKVQRYKFGVIYCKGPQIEETIFAQDDTSPEFEEFLGFLGDKIQLQGWTGYKGDLDVKHGGTGTHSYACTWKHLEIMFQVSSLIPKDRRKALIGNTVTTLIFQDGGEFNPETITSQVLHVIVVVQPIKDQKGPNGQPLYRVGIASKKGVPRFRPSLPLPAVFEKGDTFRELLFHKMINGERAAYHCSSKVRRQARSLVEIMQQTRAGHMEYAINKTLQNAKKNPKKTHWLKPWATS